MLNMHKVVEDLILRSHNTTVSVLLDCTHQKHLCELQGHVTQLEIPGGSFSVMAKSDVSKS